MSFPESLGSNAKQILKIEAKAGIIENEFPFRRR